MTDEPAEAFLCPYCDARYPTEMFVRVHVSYATDGVHEGHDGMTPEVEPVECDADGERVGTAFTIAGRLTPRGLSLADVPTGHRGREFDERERRALLVAARNANEGLSDAELRDRVATHLAEHGHDPLPADRLRALCRHVFCPHEDGRSENEGGSTITTAETTLRELTALQQAIVLAHLTRPTADPADLARSLGTARSYPSRVLDTRSELVARLRSRLDGGASPERLVAERVPAGSLDRIREEGYLDGFDLDLAAADERKRRHTERSESRVRHPVSTDTERSGDRETDANPGTERVERSETPQTGGDGAIPRGEIEAIRGQIAFDLAVVEQEMELADPTPQQVRTKAYLERILARLDEVLADRSG